MSSNKSVVFHKHDETRQYTATLIMSHIHNSTRTHRVNSATVRLRLIQTRHQIIPILQNHTTHLRPCQRPRLPPHPRREDLAAREHRAGDPTTRYPCL